MNPASGKVEQRRRLAEQKNNLFPNKSGLDEVVEKHGREVLSFLIYQLPSNGWKRRIDLEDWDV